MKIKNISEYAKLEPFLNCRLGITESETAELLAAGEGPEIGLMENGCAFASWPPCSRDRGDRRAISPSSAGGILRQGHPANAVIRALIAA